MNDRKNHIPDHELLMAADGELSRRRMAEVSRHLASCWKCRTRLQGLERAIAGFIDTYTEMDASIPPPDGPRARLSAEMRERLAQGVRPTRNRRVPYAFVAAVVLMAVAGAALLVSDDVPSREMASDLAEAGPDPTLTPGATAPVTEFEVCSIRSDSHDAAISPTVGRVVFAAYGIRDPQPGAYELDYLIAPELGGSAEVSNLWPQPYSEPVWSARVKDALEDHLHRLVCDGHVALRTAQHEIAEDWIAAYKKHFDTEIPISAHRQFVKDEPWVR